MLSNLKKLALAGALSLGLLVAFSAANDRGGFLRLGDVLSVGREIVPTRSPAAAAQGSGCLPTTGTVSGLTFAQGVNSAIAALISSNSGASPPSTDCTAAPVKGQVWLDTSVTPNVEKRYDGTAWVAVGAIDSVNHVWSPPIGGGMASVTAASTTDICAAPASLQTISGTTTITSFGSSCPVGATKKLRFSAATPITYNAASLILPAQRDFIAAAGDMADATYLGAGNWQISSITKIDGSSVTNPAVPLSTVLYGDYGTLPAKAVYGIGQALSRSAYPDYFAAATRAQTGTLTSGNNTVTSVANTAGFGAGMPIEGTGIQAGTTITSVTSSTIVMSQTATANGSQTVRVFPTGYGSGGDSTTVGVKNCQGKTLAGRDPTGTVLTAAGSGINGAALNATGGSQSKIIQQPNLPNLNLAVNTSGTVTVNTTRGDILFSTSTIFYQGGGASVGIPGAAGVITSTGVNSMTGFTASLNGSVTQTALNGMQPTVTAECVVMVLP
jgi:hypothetical protein